MSYQVLARKWRPHNFESLIGQDHVVRALTHALKENRIHHAYLFTGTRGVGKTTISRILAKCLNCIGEDGKGGITSEPCGVCEVCRAIDEDRFVDYIEMDAASTRGIDDMVALLERAKYAPTNARFKVYMIDEVHQLTTAAFNAMLKTLEEPPEYVKFILATTDPQKVPVTVLSRCLQFNLKSLSPQAISHHMSDVLQKEEIPFENGALKMLAQGARGSMRDGLSLLDQAIAFSAGNVTVESVREMLGTIDSTTLLRLLACIAHRDSKGMMDIADEIGIRSLSYVQALKDLASLLQRIAMIQYLPTSYNDEADGKELKELAGEFSPDEVQLYYQIAINGRNEIHLAPDEYAGFTMCLLRMMAFAPYKGNLPRSVPAPIESKVPPKNTTGESQEKTESSPQKTIPTAAQKSESVKEKIHSEVNVKTDSSINKKAEIAEEEYVAEDDDPPWEGEDSLSTSFMGEQLRGESLAPIEPNAWLDVAQKIRLSPKYQALVINAELISDDGSVLKLMVGEAFKPLLTQELLGVLNQEVNKYLPGRTVEIDVGSTKGASLRNLLIQKFEKEKDEAFVKISSEQTIKKFSKVFGAKLDKNQFEMLDSEGRPIKLSYLE